MQELPTSSMEKSKETSSTPASAKLVYTREQLLSKYRRFQCPEGLQAHSLIYNPNEIIDPELYNPPQNLNTAVGLKKPPRTAVAAAVGAALNNKQLPSVAPSNLPAPQPEVPSSSIGPIPPMPLSPMPVPREKLKDAVVRWSDGRPLYMVAYTDLLPVAEKFAIKRSIMRGRRYQEMYEALVADLYHELVRQKRLILPPPLTQSFRLTSETSVALWPTFRELFVHSEDLLGHLSLWESSLAEFMAPVDDAVVVLSPDVCWEYLDPQNNVQGPFTSIKMSEWFRGDFFPPNLPIRMCGSTQFVPLADLYPFDCRDTYVPFVTTPPMEALLSPPAAGPALLTATTTSAPEAMVSSERKQVSKPILTKTASQPAGPANHGIYKTKAKQMDSYHDVARMERQREEEMKRQEEIKRAEAERMRMETERIAAAILKEKQRDSEEQARREQARKEKEARDARILAEQQGIENAIKQTGIPAVVAPSPAASGPKWRQPVVIDDHEAGPSLEESRQIKGVTKNTVGTGTEWSKRVAAKAGKSVAAKGKKIEDVLPTKSAWQIKPVPLNPPPDAPWSNEPSLYTAATAFADQAIRESAPVNAPKPVVPPKQEVVTTPQPPPSAAKRTPAVNPTAAADDTRFDIQDLCSRHHIDLDPDFVTMLIGLPDLDTVNSFLIDNLPHLSDDHVSDFAEAFWDVVRNPFQPAAPKKSTSRRK